MSLVGVLASDLEVDAIGGCGLDLKSRRSSVIEVLVQQLEVQVSFCDFSETVKACQPPGRSEVTYIIGLLRNVAESWDRHLDNWWGREVKEIWDVQVRLSGFFDTFWLWVAKCVNNRRRGWNCPVTRNGESRTAQERGALDWVRALAPQRLNWTSTRQIDIPDVMKYVLTWAMHPGYCAFVVLKY